MKKQRICITFAGPIGASKSPIAHYLGHNLNLPIFNTDAIRMEVIEDFLASDNAFLKKPRITSVDILKRNNLFLNDYNIDRGWADFYGLLDAYNYKDECAKRRDGRSEKILRKGISFINDASVDRGWADFNKLLVKYRYKWFIISLDFGKTFLTKFYQAKRYDASLLKIDQLLADHEKFLEVYGDQVGFHINEANFCSRLSDSLQRAKKFIKHMQN